MALRANTEVPRADLLTVIKRMEETYPERKVLLQLSDGRQCRVVDVLIAAVKGHHNKKQHLLEVEEVVEVMSEPTEEGGEPVRMLAPTGKIYRTHMGIADVIGMM